MRTLLLALLGALSLVAGSGCRLFCDDCGSWSHYEAVPTSYAAPR